jgi:hypothetical protein
MSYDCEKLSPHDLMDRRLSEALSSVMFMAETSLVRRNIGWHGMSGGLMREVMDDIPRGVERLVVRFLRGKFWRVAWKEDGSRPTENEIIWNVSLEVKEGTQRFLWQNYRAAQVWIGLDLRCIE